MKQIEIGQTCNNCGTTNAPNSQICACCGASLSTNSSSSVYVKASLWSRRVTGALTAGQLLGGRYRVARHPRCGRFSAVDAGDVGVVLA